MEVLEIWNRLAQASCLVVGALLLWLSIDAVRNRSKRKSTQNNKWFLKNVIWVAGMPFERQYRCVLKGRNHILVWGDDRGWQWCFEPASSSDLLPYCPAQIFAHHKDAMEDALEWWNRTGGSDEVA